MPIYKVLRPIEHNRKLHLPYVTDALPTVKGAGDGQDIPVDASGLIELTEKEAAALDLGQVEAVTPEPKTEGPRAK